jgi:hypothetical protein
MAMALPDLDRCGLHDTNPIMLGQLINFRVEGVRE